MKDIIFLLAIAIIISYGCGTPKGAKDQGKPKVLYESTATVLQYLDLVPGSGTKPSFGNKVQINIIGKLEDGTILENSYDDGGPIEFTIGDGEAIRGLEEGLMMMQAGGKRRLVIPPELAYGNRGVGNNVPPNATLIIDVELLSVE